jgi:hypothetical protein
MCCRRRRLAHARARRVSHGSGGSASDVQNHSGGVVRVRNWHRPAMRFEDSLERTCRHPSGSGRQAKGRPTPLSLPLDGHAGIRRHARTRTNARARSDPGYGARRTVASHSGSLAQYARAWRPAARAAGSGAWTGTDNRVSFDDPRSGHVRALLNRGAARARLTATVSRSWRARATRSMTTARLDRPPADVLRRQRAATDRTQRIPWLLIGPTTCAA